MGLDGFLTLWPKPDTSLRKVKKETEDLINGLTDGGRRCPLEAAWWLSLIAA